MSDVKAPALSNFAAFVQGDIKGGAHAHAYRMTQIRVALEQAFKGNYSPLSEALALTEGKAKKARAYHAGFVAAGVHADPLQSDVKKVPYVGALAASHNADARAEIETRTHAAVLAFEAAFTPVMEAKAPKKAPVATPEPVEPAAPAKVEAEAGDDSAAPASVTLGVSELVDTVADAIKGGLLDTSDITLLRAALAAYDAAQVVETARTGELATA